jgi:transposase
MTCELRSGERTFSLSGTTPRDRISRLLSRIATCVACEINPLAYLADVLIRVHTHQAQELDELLPDRWLALLEKS